MSLSGIKVPEKVVKQYETMRFEKKPGGLVIIVNDEALSIERQVDGNFDQLIDELPDAEPRFVLYDIPVKNRANLDDLRTIFLFWMPMSSPVRLRMKYASSKSLITTNFRGIATQLQEEEKSDLSYDYILSKINKQQGINNF